nr:HD2 mating type protein [Mycoleptodonoides aitchisonii]
MATLNPSIDALQRIAGVAHRLSLLTFSLRSTPYAKTPLPSSTVGDVIFPEPQPLTDGLIARGIDSATASDISQAYMKAVSRLRGDFILKFGQADRAMQADRSDTIDRSRPGSSLRMAFDKLYAKMQHGWMEKVYNDIVPRILKARRSCACSSFKGRRSFSSDITPILENFFESNAFPSRLDKHDLADETGLTYKQVHVWFQNHRSRYRREGRELKRGNPSSILPKEVEDSALKFLALSQEENSDGLSDNTLPSSPTSTSSCPPIKQGTTFNLDPPPHAFPSAYPPPCDYAPFPISEGARNFPVYWDRQPHTSVWTRVSVVDVKDLTIHFAKMTLKNQTPDIKHENQCPLSTSIRPSHPVHPPPIIGFASFAPRAPLDALVRPTKRRVPTTNVAPSTIVASVSSTPHHIKAIRAPREGTMENSSDKTSSRGKLAPFPRRTRPGAHSNQTPTTSIRRRGRSHTSTSAPHTLPRDEPCIAGPVASSSTNVLHHRPSSPSVPMDASSITSGHRDESIWPTVYELHPSHQRPKGSQWSRHSPSSLPRISSMSSISSDSSSTSSSGPDTPLSTPPLPPSCASALKMPPIFELDSYLSTGQDFVWSVSDASFEVTSQPAVDVQ